MRLGKRTGIRVYLSIFVESEKHLHDYYHSAAPVRERVRGLMGLQGQPHKDPRVTLASVWPSRNDHVRVQIDIVRVQN